MLPRYIRQPTIHERPAPKRVDPRNAHRNPTFWIAWAACSLLLWLIVLKFVPFPPPGTTIDYAHGRLIPAPASGPVR